MKKLLLVLVVLGALSSVVATMWAKALADALRREKLLHADAIAMKAQRVANLEGALLLKEGEVETLLHELAETARALEEANNAVVAATRFETQRRPIPQPPVREEVPCEVVRAPDLDEGGGEFSIGGELVVVASPLGEVGWTGRLWADFSWPDYEERVVFERDDVDITVGVSEEVREAIRQYNAPRPVVKKAKRWPWVLGAGVVAGWVLQKELSDGGEKR